MSQTLNLYRLQQIDSQLDRAQARLQAIQKTLEDDVELRLANEQAQAAQAHCQSAERALKQAEAGVQSQHIKIEQNESSLYSGTVHNPKELQDLQNDVAALKRHLNTLEDRQLEAMLVSEEAEAGLRSIQTNLVNAQDRWAELTKSLSEEQNVLQSLVGRFSTERTAVAEVIPAAEFSLYDQLRQQRRGVAVASISDNSCGACGSTLSLAQMQSARSSSQMALCPSCGRILYRS
jgi:predicted  nucleic acid-binding Zn-ribbon protein